MSSIQKYLTLPSVQTPDSRLDLSVYRHLIHLPQVIPVPKAPCDALRQAFIDHGKSQGVELSDIPRDASLSKVGMC